jgi:sRNA-binding regulator protein Hfq
VKSIHHEIEKDLVWSFPFVDSNINVGEILEDTSKFGGTISQGKTYIIIVKKKKVIQIVWIHTVDTSVTFELSDN